MRFAGDPMDPLREIPNKAARETGQNKRAQSD
jgi:hypothetical protein